MNEKPDNTDKKVDTKFKSGEEWNGNDKGRPLGSKNFSTIFEDAIKIIVKEQRIPVKNPEVEMVVKAVIQALRGNYAFYKDLMDRNYGSTGKGAEVNIDNRSITFIGSPEQYAQIDDYVNEEYKCSKCDGEIVRKINNYKGDK